MQETFYWNKKFFIFAIFIILKEYIEDNAYVVFQQVVLRHIYLSRRIYALVSIRKCHAQCCNLLSNYFNRLLSTYCPMNRWSKDIQKSYILNFGVIFFLQFPFSVGSLLQLIFIWTVFLVLCRSLTGLQLTLYGFQAYFIVLTYCYYKYIVWFSCL